MSGTARVDGRFTRKVRIRGDEGRNALALSWRLLLPGFIERFRRRYPWATSTRYPMEDAMADAWLGCQRAAELFDPELGQRPSPYLWPWVLSALQQGVEACRNVRRPGMKSGSYDRKHLDEYRLRSEGPLPKYFDMPDPSPGPVEEADKRDRLDMVRRELGRMPARDREILLLWSQGVRDVDIGNRFGVSKQAINHVRHELIATLSRKFKRAD